MVPRAICRAKERRKRPRLTYTAWLPRNGRNYTEEEGAPINIAVVHEATIGGRPRSFTRCILLSVPLVSPRTFTSCINRKSFLLATFCNDTEHRSPNAICRLSASPPDSVPIQLCIVSFSFTPPIYERRQVNGIWLICLPWFPIALLYRWARAAQLKTNRSAQFTTTLAETARREQHNARTSASDTLFWAYIDTTCLNYIVCWHEIVVGVFFLSVTLSKCQEWFEYPNLPIDIGSNAHKLLALEASKRRMETCRWIYQWHWS